MILMNADGFGSDRIHKVKAGLEDLLTGSDNSMTINKTVGAGVVSDLREVLELFYRGVKFTDVRLAHTNDADVYELERNTNIAEAQLLIADEADQLDRQPKVAAWFREQEATKKVIYIISTSPTAEQLEEGFEKLRMQLQARREALA